MILFNGAVPAYRDLSDGVSDGPDVKELEQNLVALGFDPSHEITVNDTFDSATAMAVERWQASVGETQTGVVTLGQVVFLPVRSGSPRSTRCSDRMAAATQRFGVGQPDRREPAARPRPASS